MKIDRTEERCDCRYISWTTTKWSVRRDVITYAKCLSDIRKIYPKVASDFKKNFFRISKLAAQYVCMLVRNTKISSQYFGHHVSDIVSDTQKPFRICYDASPYNGISVMRWQELKGANIKCDVDENLRPSDETKSKDEWMEDTKQNPS